MQTCTMTQKISPRQWSMLLDQYNETRFVNKCDANVNIYW